MVDATQAMESEYVTVDVVRNLTKKQLVITGEGSYEETDWGAKLTLPVQLEGGRDKKYRPNKDSAKNLAALYGRNSKNWLGKIIALSTIIIMGKECVIAVPTHDIADGKDDVKEEAVK